MIMVNYYANSVKNKFCSLKIIAEPWKMEE